MPDAPGIPAHRLAVADVMVCAMAAEIVDGDFVGVGLGTPLALAAVLLARATHGPGTHLLAGGAIDADADLVSYLGGSRSLVGRATGFVSHFDSMDMAERQAMTLQFLRPAQVDGAGNLNTSRIGPIDGPSVRFPGGLATGDVPTLLPRLVAYLPDHRQRNLPEHVAFVTGSGGGLERRPYHARGVVTVVTDLACIAITPDGPILRSVHPWASVEQVVGRTGFELVVPGDVGVTHTPTSEQAATLHEIDPRGIRAGEIRTTPATEVASAQEARTR